MTKDGHLNILFPQWQGGKNRLVSEAAKNFAAKLAGHIKEIALDTTEVLKIENNIRGYGVLKSQFNKAFDLIVLNNPDTIINIGGDCSVSLAPIAFLNNKYAGNLAVLWLDAHGDINSPAGSTSKALHGMPLRLLLGDDEGFLTDKVQLYLNRRQILLAGVRDLDEAECDYIESNNIALVKPPALEAAPQQPATYIKDQGFDNVFIHLDVDVLEPAEFDFCGYAVGGGITLQTLYALIDALRANLRIVGFSLTEFLPCDAKGTDTLNSLLRKAKPQL